MGRQLRVAGRVMALAGCAATAVSWSSVLWQALQHGEETLPLAVIAALMIILCIAGLNAALAEAPRAMFLVSLAWFFPFGLYLTASGAWYVGVSNLLYLLGAIQLHLGGRRSLTPGS